MFSHTKTWKTFGILILLLIILSQTTLPAHSGPAVAQSSRTQVHVKVALVDGSLIMGIAQNNYITITHTVFRRLPIPLTKVKILEKNPAKNALRIILDNNDRISGAWTGEMFSMKTAVGVIDVPLDVLKSIEITEVVRPQPKIILLMFSEIPPRLIILITGKILPTKNMWSPTRATGKIKWPPISPITIVNH